MKPVFLASILLLALTGAAMAQDDPSPPSPPVQNWTTTNNGQPGDLLEKVTDKDGVVRTLKPGDSSGFDPASCPCTVEFVQE